jgi:hypothetical protein
MPTAAAQEKNKGKEAPEQRSDEGSTEPAAKKQKVSHPDEAIPSGIDQFLKEQFREMRNTHAHIRSALDLQFVELKGLAGRIAQTHAPASTSQAPQEIPSHERVEELTERHTVVHIPPTSMTLPDPLAELQVSTVGPVEINLSLIPIETLQLVHEKVSLELRARELSTFQENQRLQSQEIELKESHQNISAKLALYEAQDTGIRTAIEEIAQELPACEIQPDLPLVAKVQIIGGRVKTLEQEKVAMAEDHRTQIAELEARVAAQTTDDAQVQFEALSRASMQMKNRVQEAENLMNQAMEAWTELVKLPFKVGLSEQVQAAEQSLAVLNEEAKSLTGLPKMKKMGEVRKMQQQLHKLRTEDEKLTNSIQPFMDEYAEIVGQVETKIKEIAESQEIIDTLTKEDATAETVQTAVECVDELDSAIAKWKNTFAETQARADAQIKRPHASASGSRASHK